MKIFFRLMILILITALFSSCTNSKTDPIKTSEADPIEIFKNADHIIELGGAAYTSEELDNSFISMRSADEEYYIYDADDRYLVYGISKVDASDSYLLTKNLNLYDYRKGVIIKSIPFEESAYVGDAIIKGDSLFYSRVPISEIAETSASWEIHESNGESDIIRAKGISSYSDNYPQFTVLNDKILYSYEDQRGNHEFTFGCKIIDGYSTTTLFSYDMDLDTNKRTSFLSNQVYGNGKSAFMFLYEAGKLYYMFFNEKGTISKTLFEDHMYHCGLLKDGLILSQVINQDMKNQYYQVSVISDKGKADSFPDRNCRSYFRFTSGPVSHSMAIDGDSLYFFEYENEILKRTKVTIPDTNLSNVTPYYIGNNDYLIEDLTSKGNGRLFIIHIK